MKNQDKSANFSSSTPGLWTENNMHESVGDLAEELVKEETDGSDTTNSCSQSNEILQKQSVNIEKTTKRAQLAALLVVIMGAAASAGFLYMGISSAKNDSEGNFERAARDMAKLIDGSWKDYESSALWIHESCRNWRTNNFSREDFEALYNYLISDGVEFEAAQWVPNVTHADRAALEEEGKIGWGSVPGVDYVGFIGKEPDPEHPGELTFMPRSEQPWYFPIQYGEPKKFVAPVAHYDLFSEPNEQPTIASALRTWQPALTARFILPIHLQEHVYGYSVVLYHPGTPLPEKFHAKPRDLSDIVIYIPALLERAGRSHSQSLSVYLYDKTVTNIDGAPPEYMSGIQIKASKDNKEKEMTRHVETEYADLDNTGLFFEQEMEIGGRVWLVVVLPLEGTHEADLTFIWLSGILLFAASVLLAIWMIHNMRRSIEMHRVISKAAAEAAIVSNLFPANVLERMIQDAEAKNKSKLDRGGNKDAFLNDGKREQTCKMANLLTSEGIFGSKPIAELHPYTTVMVADLCGFTAWASSREPSQVFTLLEIIYHSWDSIAKRRRVYKVETVGDSYVAVAGLPQPRSDHAVVMVRFATDCANRMLKLCRALETTLGPDTGDLQCRFGLHSGQVVAGVLRGDKGRFQLFGDSINMASRMESTGANNKIHVSQETAEQLTTAGFGKWVIPREDLVNVKGKGALQTFFVKVTAESRGSVVEEIPESHPMRACASRFFPDCGKTTRLVEWNVEVLTGLLRSIVARRAAMAKGKKRPKTEKRSLVKGGIVLDEVVETIALPEFDASAFKKQVDPDSIELDDEVVEQLSKYIKTIADGYRNNPFHNFEHASHVTMSVVKMMGRIVDPKEIAATKEKQDDYNQQKLEAELHDHTFGITSDPLTQFSCAFSALIHDLDHQGVPNTTLVQEESPLALKYKNMSVAEQNSVDLAWELLMCPEYDKLRACLCCDDEEFARFRSLVVNSVMATDIMDKALGAARKARWNKAFSGSDDGIEDSQVESDHVKINRKATIVIEHLIQASDISHTMQHWHVYAKWNERLFLEMYKAYKAGRLDKDPSIGWYQGEIGFFDFYIIPLAKKLFTCGVFGVSSDEFLNYALTNRKEWIQKGEGMVKRYLEAYAEEMAESANTDVSELVYV